MISLSYVSILSDILYQLLSYKNNIVKKFLYLCVIDESKSNY